MTKTFDERTLSAFIDGELDAIAMREVDEFLQQDEKAQHYVLNAARTTAFLRASSNEALHEEIPERLLVALDAPQVKQQRRSPAIRSLFQIAAAIVLVFIGFGAGTLQYPKNWQQFPTSVAPVLDKYGHIVNAALEHNLSGNPHKWSEPQQTTIIIVTPIKTYRDKNKLYYREYRLEVVEENNHLQASGLAYRTADGNWVTKALFF
jgi:hypothetical protein